MAEIIGVIAVFAFVGLAIYAFKYMVIYLLGLMFTAYDITIFPEKTFATNRKNGQKFEVNNFFYTGFSLNQRAACEVIIALGEVEISELELKQRLNGQYKNFRKYTFDKTYERVIEFWRVILLTLVTKELSSKRSTMMFGRHRISIQKFSPEQLPKVEKAVKAALFNAKVV